MMESTEPSVLENLLRASQRGATSATEDLFVLLYDQLRGIASQQLRGERMGHTLQATALVHEAWFKLGDVGDLGAIDGDAEAHLLAIAGRAMRQVLVDYSRRVTADKRVVPAGGQWVSLSEQLEDGTVAFHGVFEIDDAVRVLAIRYPRCAQVAGLRVFDGMTNEEVADELQLSRTTVKRDWALARALLCRHLEGG